MSLDDVYLVSCKLQTTPRERLDDLETQLGMPLPLGYREYLQTLGEGDFCHDLHVLSPERVLDDSERTWWSKTYLPVAIEEEFWEDRPLLTDDELSRCVLFARSDEGDQFVSCPDRPGELFELPRHEARMHHYPNGFLDPFQFEFCRLGNFHFPFFEPPQSRQVSFHLNLSNNVDPQIVWEYLDSLHSTPLKVAEGEIGGNHTITFLPDIYGCAWFSSESRQFYFFTILEHQNELNQIQIELEALIQP